MSKDTKSLLESARAAVLKEVNTSTGFLQKLLGAGDKTALREAQSAIAKAINQLDRDEGNASTAKLQTHLNEKSNRIKELEKKLEHNQEELEIITEKVKAYEAEMQKLRNATVPSSPATIIQENNNSAELEKLQERCESLAQRNKELEERNNNLYQESKEAWELSLEFNKRLKKLKAEILS